MELQRGETLSFQDGSRRWAHVKRFALKSATAATVLSEWVRPEELDDAHLGGTGDVSGVRGEADRVHGPYRASDLSPADYVRVDESRVWRVFARFANSNTLPADSLIRRLEAALDGAFVADAESYELRPRGAREHAAGWVLDHFEEFFLVAPAERTAWSLVLGID